MPLQKSFSDQNHSSVKRSPWRRRRTYPGVQRQEPQPPKDIPEKPPVPVSTITKQKLNAFQFEAAVGEKHPVPDVTILLTAGDDKENTPAKASKDSTAGRLGLSERHTNELILQHDDDIRRNMPTTPAGRMALLDLMGVGDVETHADETSPEEHVMWNHKASQSSAASEKSLKRGLKRRARSSSPTSSPTLLSNRQAAKGEKPALQKLHSPLKTPQVDPGSELWGRYVYSTDGGSARCLQHPALADIISTSSPQPASGLKRKSPFSKSASCGPQWPRVKRQKIDAVQNSKATDDVFLDSNTNDVRNPSRIKGFLQGVQEHLNSSAKVETPEASSSTQQDQHIKQEEISPTTLGHVHLSNERNVNTTPSRDTEIDIDTSERLNPTGSSSSSSYGEFNDADFEESLIEVSKDSANTQHPVASDKNIPNSLPIPTNLADSGDNSLSSTTLKEDEDMFDDIDDDDFADLEEVVAKYDAPNEAEKIQSTQVDDEGHPGGYDGVQPPDESEDEFGNDLDDIDFEIAEATATQNLQQSTTRLPHSSQKVRAIQRYLVTNILENEYVNAKGYECPEKVLIVQVENTKAIKTILLREGWFETPVTTEAFVHIIGNFTSENQCIIDDLHNMIILHPDHLISSTVVADSFTCTRRAVLQDRVKATGETNPSLVYGTILHEIFQAAVMSNRWDSAYLEDIIDVYANRHLEDLYTIKLQIPQAIEYLKSKMGELQSWAELFVSSKPKADAIVKAGNGDTAIMCVSKLLDVEEHVWSPMYGLKGNIDATVQVTMQDGDSERTLTVPFEVKTGRNANASHRAQTALYNLLLSDRYDIEIAYGILYYMETSETIRIPAIRHELRHMIMQRNELACFVRERDAHLPPMLKKENLCNRCYAKVPCFIYHRLADDGTAETSGMKTKFDEVVKHLTSLHKEFFLKWDDLLTKEEKESLKFRRELWTMLSTQREKLGRCFSSVIIEPSSAYEDQSSQKINRFQYTLIKQSPPPGFSFIESQITVGEPIVISDEQGHFALANGFVTHVRKQRITVAVDRRLHNARIRRPGFNEVNNQVFASIMEVAGEGSSPEEIEGKIVEPPVVYRLDKDEFSNGMATVRNNLIQTMADGPFGSREIRQLVVDLKPPEFKPHSTAYTLADRKSINIDQRRAIEKVMSAQDYALVLGMPGTGKTTTIAHIIRALVSQKKSVLLTSYTHTAVDNILLKLRNDEIPILRIGSIAKVHPEVQEFAILAATPKTSFEELRSSWHDTPVVATTCLGINHPIFNERTFDYCIVDEASQITLPVCLGPIRMAHTFILVGDHNQLPPLVQNEEAREGGLDVSLFKLLSDKHPSSVVNLEHQYRMCEDVMALSNALIYNGRLKCGTPEVANRSISIPNMDALKNLHFSCSTVSKSQKSICPGATPGRCWLRDLLDPSTKVRFLNTDTLLPISREEAKGNRIVNPTEVSLCVQLVESLVMTGVPPSTIGVMTHYRSQLALLRHGLRGHKDVEMHTADRFQGRDKEVVILSLVRNNEAKSIGELLKDWRRINVAFTRAKTKLLVIGSRSTLKGSGSEEMVSKFVSLMEEKGWIYDLPKDALECHLFDESATQISASAASKPAGTQWKQVDVGVQPQQAGSFGKENVRPRPKRQQISEKVLLDGRPVLRDIMNDACG